VAAAGERDSFEVDVGEVVMFCLAGWGGRRCGRRSSAGVDGDACGGAPRKT
jgi:hypothetical protein